MCAGLCAGVSLLDSVGPWPLSPWPLEGGSSPQCPSTAAPGSESGRGFFAASILQLPIGQEEGQGGISTR